MAESGHAGCRDVGGVSGGVACERRECCEEGEGIG